MYCDVQVISGLFDFPEMRHLSQSWKEAREAVKLVRPFEKRVSGKLSVHSGKNLPKKENSPSQAVITRFVLG
jgi:hypothetical protein